jgi:hypothetical protein
MNIWQRFLRIGIDHPLAVAVFLLVTSVVAGFGLWQLRFDTGPGQLLAREAQERQAYLHVARVFGPDSRIVIVARDEQLWSAKKLQTLEQLHHELQRLPFVQRVDDIFTSPTVRGVDGQLVAQPLLATAPVDDAGAEQARAAVLEDPIATRNLVSPDGKALALVVSLRENMQGMGSRDINETIETVLTQARAQLPMLEQFGAPRLEAELRRMLPHELVTQALAAAALVAVMAFVLSRSVLAALFPAVVAAISLLWALGLMGALSIPLSAMFVALPPLLVIIGAIEILRVKFGGGDVPPAQAIDFMVRNFGAPAALMTTTIALGFACLMLSDIPSLRDLGLIGAVAFLANGLVATLLLPLLYRAMAKQQERLVPWMTALMEPLTRLARSRVVQGGLALLAAVCVVLLVMAPRLHIAHDPLSFFKQSGNPAQASERAGMGIAGTRTFYVTLDANTEGAFRDPANIQRLADIQAFIAKQQIFDRSLSLADLMSQANREAAGGRSAAYVVPPTRRLVAQYLLLYQPRDLEPYVSHDFRRANIVVRHDVRDAALLNHHLSELRLAAMRYAGASLSASVVGEDVLVNDSGNRLPRQALGVAAGILIFIFFAVSLMFTSTKGGIGAVVASATPILLLLAVMRIFEMPLDMGSVVVVVIVFGIAIEATAQMFARYSELCRDARSYDEAMVTTLRREVPAGVVVGLVLALAFATLHFSALAPIARLGTTAGIAMLLVILVNLLVTPIIMARMRLVGLYEILAMAMPRDALEACPLFAGLTSYQIRKTILISELREYADGELLIEQGTVGRSMYLVVSGQIEVSRRDGDNVKRLALLGPGEVFGEIGFVNDTYRTADVTAVGPVSVLRFDHQRLRKDLALFPHLMAKLNFNISGILGHRLAELVEAQQSKQTS